MATRRWEYMVLDIRVSGFLLGPKLDGEGLTNKLNELGDDGWELVSLTEMSFAEGGTSDLVAVLKRPRG